VLGKTRHLVEGRADAHADDKRRTRIGGLLANARQERIHDALLAGTGHEHDNPARVI
jgi:hypothetical protein